MEQQKRFPAIVRLLGTIALIDLGLAVAVGLIHLLAGWKTAYQYGEGLVWAGMAAIALGALSVGGNYMITRNTRYQYGQTVSVMSTYERAQQAMQDTLQGYGCLIVMVAVGLISIGMGALIQTVLP